jgi:hypothetical protein
VSDFFPDVSTMPRPGGYSGLYRLFTDQAWKYVSDPKTKKPIVFPGVGEAVKAARETVRLKLNPHIRSQAGAVAVEPDDEDILGIEEWMKGKQEDTAKTRALIKNGKHYKPFKVEIRARKRGK